MKFEKLERHYFDSETLQHTKTELSGTDLEIGATEITATDVGIATTELTATEISESEFLEHAKTEIAKAEFLQYGMPEVVGGVDEGQVSQHANTTGKFLDNLSMQHECRRCGKTYDSVVKLQRHIRIHMNQKEVLQCDRCFKYFRSKASLRKHISEHILGKIFSCEWCLKKFTQMSSLREHYRTHTGEKPYICNVCNQAFTTSSNRNRHKRTHTGLRPYACVGCKKTFSQTYGLQRHLDAVCETVHKCPVCGEEFPNNKFYEAHAINHKGLLDIKTSKKIRTTPTKMRARRNRRRKNKNIEIGEKFVRSERVLPKKIKTEPVDHKTEPVVTKRVSTRESNKLFRVDPRMFDENYPYNDDDSLWSEPAIKKCRIQPAKLVPKEKPIRRTIRNLLQAPLDRLTVENSRQLIEGNLGGSVNSVENKEINVPTVSDFEEQSQLKLPMEQREKLAQQMKAIVPPATSPLSSKTVSDDSDSDGDQGVEFVDTDDEEVEYQDYDDMFDDMAVLTSVNVVGLSEPVSMVIVPEFFKPSAEVPTAVCYKDRTVQNWKILDATPASVDFLM